jgi:catechol 2,3-dioxygenase-like lactoylglutathione lyase family enzyme
MSDQRVAEPASQKTGIVSPTRLAHLVLRTSRIKDLLAWYKLVLNAEVAFENDEIAFIAYDDEHHRIAFVNIPGLAPQPAGMVGMHHIAFTYASLDELLGNYEILRDQGIVPKWCVNHGPTTSMYYGDPEDNQVELQVDNYATVEEAGAFFFTEAFATNTIGVDFDPEDLLRRVRAGEDQGLIKRRPPSGQRGVDTIPIR